MENTRTQLQQFLQSLCTNSPWSYTTFWMLHQPDIFLTCEDGYFDYSRLQGSSQSILNDGHARHGNASNFVSATNLPDGQSLGNSIRTAIADMSCHRYELGEGIVGIVAASASDLWIYFDDMKSMAFLSALKYPDEWHLATTVGIKTTLLVPVMPHGVLQLGSLEKVAQNQEMVGAIIEKFFVLVNCSSSFTSRKNFLASSSSHMKDIDNDGSSYILENFLQMEDTPKVSPLEYDIDPLYMYQDFESESTAFTGFLMDDLLEKSDNIWELCHEEGYSNDRVSGESFTGTSDNLFHDGTHVVPTLDVDHDADYINLEYLDGFLKGFEVSEEFGEDFETTNRNNQTMDFGQENDQEHVLEALLTELYDSSYDIMSYNSYMSSLTSPTQNSTNQNQFSFDATATLTIDGGTLVNNEESNTESLDQSIVGTCLTSPRLFESILGALPKDKHVVESSHVLSDKSAKEPEVGKHKTKAKNCHRKRPRDRQLIQNRLNELRKLVPNVEQCSIDSLLEQTIEHMAFLTSVAEQADKLKEFNTMLINNKNEKDTTKTCCVTSRALKVEQSSRSCPVIVKELEHPGQLLIQMLCDDQTAFFEMAEVIHRLKLTIIKGVMESCCSNWAHFVVQASIGFNRLDIFWPLMKILQRNGNWAI